MRVMVSQRDLQERVLIHFDFPFVWGQELVRKLAELANRGGKPQTYDYRAAFAELLARSSFAKCFWSASVGSALR